MSNRICKRCRSTNVVVHGSYGGTTYYYCKACQDWGEKDQFPEQTLFDQITASPEALAEKLVYKKIDSFYYTSGGVVRWTSPISDWEYDTKPEAIAATVAKLKEVCDE